MHSCFYEGTVRHRRHHPVRHDFAYRLFMVYVDLAELPALFGGWGLWSLRRPAVARFCREDHVGHPSQPLDTCVRDLVAQQLGWRPQGPIRLLTHFRTFGFQMNPISLYYCFAPQGGQLQAVVGEVNNTPWGQRHCYVLDLRMQRASRSTNVRLDKQFHVSPFLPMDLQYRWRIRPPGERLLLHLDVCQRDAPLLDATLVMRRRSLTRWQRLRMLLRYPAMTLQVYGAIHWQALRLWKKGAPFFPHPHKKSERLKPALPEEDRELPNRDPRWNHPVEPSPCEEVTI